MSRINRSHTEQIAGMVARQLGVEIETYYGNGYYHVDLGDTGRTLKVGTLRECDTFLRGMLETLDIQTNQRSRRMMEKIK